MSDDIHAADGRIIGARAQATRRKLLDATAKLLTEQGIHRSARRRHLTRDRHVTGHLLPLLQRRR